MLHNHGLSLISLVCLHGHSESRQVEPPFSHKLSNVFSLVLPQGLAHFGIDNAALERLGLDHQARKGSAISFCRCESIDTLYNVVYTYTLEIWVKINSPFQNIGKSLKAIPTSYSIQS